MNIPIKFLIIIIIIIMFYKFKQNVEYIQTDSYNNSYQARTRWSSFQIQFHNPPSSEKNSHFHRIVAGKPGNTVVISVNSRWLDLFVTCRIHSTFTQHFTQHSLNIHSTFTQHSPNSMLYTDTDAWNSTFLLNLKYHSISVLVVQTYLELNVSPRAPTWILFY